MLANRPLATTLAATALLAGCGGGGSHESKAISETLVADGPSGCVIQAEIDTGPDTAGPGDGACLSGVVFHLFDRAGNELPVHQPLNIFPAEKRVHLRQRICSGDVQPLHPNGVDVSSTSLFLLADADACPGGTTAPGDLGLGVPLARPLREVPCGDVGRVETDVFGCDD